jgi:hypothetical protein
MLLNAALAVRIARSPELSLTGWRVLLLCALGGAADGTARRMREQALPPEPLCAEPSPWLLMPMNRS